MPKEEAKEQARFVLGDPKAKEKSVDYDGQARCLRISPPMARSHRIDITFEEALKFNVALQSAVIELNRYDRKTDADMGLHLTVMDGVIKVFHTRIHGEKDDTGK